MKHHSHTMAGPFSHGHTRFTACRWDMPIFLTPELGALCYLEGGWSTNLATSARLSNPFLSCIHPNTNPRQWIQAFLCVEAWRRNFLPMATKLTCSTEGTPTKWCTPETLNFHDICCKFDGSSQLLKDLDSLKTLKMNGRSSPLMSFFIPSLGWPQKMQPWKIGEGIIAWEQFYSMMSFQMGVVAWVMRNGSLLQCTSRPYTQVML